MIEVFKTNVIRRSDAVLLVNRINAELPGHVANFDLDDCDRILRVKSEGNILLVNSILRLIESEGFNAEILPDEPGVNQRPEVGGQRPEIGDQRSEAGDQRSELRGQTVPLSSLSVF
jgi:hypothetical protein